MEYTDPSVVGLAGEIWPQEVVPGRRDTFAVFVSAAVVERPNPSPGFDELRLRSEPALDMELIDAALGTEGEFAAGEPYRLYANRVEEGLAAAEGDLLRVLSGRGDSLQVRFPEVLERAVGNGINTFYRRVEEGEEVPTSEGGTLLDQVAYSRLPEQQQGAIRYFQKLEGDDGESLEEVDEQTFADLAPRGERAGAILPQGDIVDEGDRFRRTRQIASRLRRTISCPEIGRAKWLARRVWCACGSQPRSSSMEPA